MEDFFLFFFFLFDWEIILRMRIRGAHYRRSMRKIDSGTVSYRWAGK